MVLVPEDAEHEGRGPVPERGEFEGGGESPGRLRIMRPVQHVDRSVLLQHLETPGPGYAGETFGYMRPCYGRPSRAQERHAFVHQSSVRGLRRPQQRQVRFLGRSFMPQPHAPARPIVGGDIEDRGQEAHLRGPPPGFGEYGAARLLRKQRRQAYPAVLYYPRFLRRYLAYGAAQIILMVQVHGRYHRQFRTREHVGGVQPAADPDLYNGDIDAGALERQESHAGQQLEKTEVRPRLENLLEEGGEILSAYFFPVYAYPLGR